MLLDELGRVEPAAFHVTGAAEYSDSRSPAQPCHPGRPCRCTNLAAEGAAHGAAGGRGSTDPLFTTAWISTVHDTMVSDSLFAWKSKL